MADWSDISNNFDADAERRWKEMCDRHFKERMDLHQAFKEGSLSNKDFETRLDDFQKREQQSLENFMKNEEVRQAEIRGEINEPPSQEQVIEAEQKRVQSDRDHLEKELQAKLDEVRKEADKTIGNAPDNTAEREAFIAAKQEALEKNHQEDLRRLETEAQQRLDRMIEPYGRDGP